METGTDGRFYDSHFDINHDGYLNCSEQLIYEQEVFGDHSGGYVGSGRFRRNYTRSNKPVSIFGVLAGLILFFVMMFLMVGGFVVAVLCPPVGAFMIFLGISLKEAVF